MIRVRGRLCPDCLGMGLTVDPGEPDPGEAYCHACRGVGVVGEGDRPLVGFALAAVFAGRLASLPFAALRDLLIFGPGFARMMARVRWGEVGACLHSWRYNRSLGDMPECDEAWFRRARLRLPDNKDPR